MSKTTGSESTLRASASHANNPADEARKILGSSACPSLRLLRCAYRGGAVVIHGLVPSFDQKQMAEVVLLKSPLIDAVVNLVEVMDSPVVPSPDRGSV